MKDETVWESEKLRRNYILIKACWPHGFPELSLSLSLTLSLSHSLTHSLSLSHSQSVPIDYCTCCPLECIQCPNRTDQWKILLVGQLWREKNTVPFLLLRGIIENSRCNQENNPFFKFLLNFYLFLPILLRKIFNCYPRPSCRLHFC